jgi:hypothetical protein
MVHQLQIKQARAILQNSRYKAAPLITGVAIPNITVTQQEKVILFKNIHLQIHLRQTPRGRFCNRSIGWTLQVAQSFTKTSNEYSSV